MTITEKLKVCTKATTMLAGEHAVVYQGRAIACALDTTMIMTLTPRPEASTIRLLSPLGQVDYCFKKQKLNSDNPCWDYFYHVIDYLKDDYMTLRGCTIEVEQSFSSTQGLGSSSAFIIGLLQLLSHYANLNWNQKTLLKHAHLIIRRKSPLASGSDLAACIYQGIVAFCPRTYSVTRLPLIDHDTLTLVYCGYKTSTDEVLRLIQKKRALEYENVTTTFNTIASVCEKIIASWQCERVDDLTVLFDQHYLCQLQLGVIDKTMRKIYYSLKSDPHLWGAKVSGSGLGDCLVAWGQTTQSHTSRALKSEQFSLKIALPV